MNLTTLAALCSLHAQQPAGNLPIGVNCANVPTREAARLTGIQELVESSDAREAITRVAYAEAGGQGDSGLAAVVFTILNRLADRRWGGSVEAVLNAPHQFEPVMRVGGSWRALRPATEAQKARIDAMINLALDGRLPDLTRGARYFQNPRIVAARAAAGTVSARLVNFGGAVPTAVIGDQSFYAGSGGAAGGPTDLSSQAKAVENGGGAIFVGENRAGHSAGLDPLASSVEDDPMALAAVAPQASESPGVEAGLPAPAPTVTDAEPIVSGAPAKAEAEPAWSASVSDPARAIFVLNNGLASAEPR